MLTVAPELKREPVVVEVKERVALITGAGRGIGQAIARRLYRDGLAVALTDVDAAAVEAAGREIDPSGNLRLAVACDVSSAAAVDQLVDTVLGRFGRLDVLVNNAGITRDNLLLRMKDEEWDSVIGVNLTGAFLCLRAVVRQMMKKRSGRVINISSVVGLMGNAGQANYCAAKAGLIGLTKSAARELASRGITVNAIAPGFIQTAMTDALPEEAKNRLQGAIPMGRLGTVDDVAAAVSYLASADADYVTGQVLQINGGMYM